MVEQYKIDRIRKIENNEVIVLDDVFQDYFVRYVSNSIFQSSIWRWGHTTFAYGNSSLTLENEESNPETPAWRQIIYPSGQPSIPEVYQLLVLGVLEEFGIQPQLNEIMINGQQNNHWVDYHKDCDCDAGISFVYHSNHEWKSEWGGTTEYIDPSTGKPVHIDYKPGRLIVMKGNLTHRGNPPSEMYRGLRTSVIIKTFKPSDDPYQF
jgi:hypothetical protein